jgi:hypothetical protein
MTDFYTKPHVSGNVLILNSIDMKQKITEQTMLCFIFQ